MLPKTIQLTSINSLFSELYKGQFLLTLWSLKMNKEKSAFRQQKTMYNDLKAPTIKQKVEEVWGVSLKD